jgi:broad specificity phosphatase PhoE
VKFFLVRHGETEWNKLGRFQGQQDIPLNELGLAQARETAQALAALKPTALYSSPLYRTMQAAEEISRAVGLPVIKEEGFKELRLGDLEGVTGQEMQERWPQIYAAWRNKPAKVVMPNGESLSQLQERVWGALLKLEKYQEESDILVVVSHNFAIRCIVAKLLGMPLSHFHRMSLSLSSICTLESNKASRRLVCYNSTCHLSPESR